MPVRVPAGCRESWIAAGHQSQGRRSSAFLCPPRDGDFAAFRRGQGAIIPHRCRTSRAVPAAAVCTATAVRSAAPTEPIKNQVFLVQMLLFGPAALPAITPVADEELEAKRVDFQAGLEADAEVTVVHFVLVNVGV